MSSFHITATNHTAFTVSDLPAAIAFFRDLLGFSATEATRQSGDAAAKITGLPGAELDIVFVETPGHKIELMQYWTPRGRAGFDLRPCDPGFAHISFEVKEIDALVSVLDSAGYRAVSAPQIVQAGPRKGGRNVYVRGPDGIVIEFQEAPQKS